MNVDQQELNRWTVQLRWTGAHVRKALGILLRRDLLDEDLSYHLMTASQRAGMVEDALIRAGADDPREAERPEGKEGREGIPLALLSSPAAKEYAEAIRSAADACRRMETERGIDPEDGATSLLESMAQAAEFEAYGPTDLGEAG
jgi:hypothetical protein